LKRLLNSGRPELRSIPDVQNAPATASEHLEAVARQEFRFGSGRSEAKFWSTADHGVHYAMSQTYQTHDQIMVSPCTTPITIAIESMLLSLRHEAARRDMTVACLITDLWTRSRPTSSRRPCSTAKTTSAPGRV
jgi:hypothetical protein